jgi:Xaa-Pro aminopeptidase
MHRSPDPRAAAPIIAAPDEVPPMDHKRQIYRNRRVALLKHMRATTGGGLALIPTAPEVARNRDSHFPYRHDSYFYYVSGFPEPEAVVALVAAEDGDRHLLFCREKNPEREVWDGFRYGPDAAREVFGFDAAHPLGEMDSVLADLCCDRPALYTPLGLLPAWDRKVTDLINEVRGRARTGVAPPEHIVDVRQSLDAMRLVKDAHEQALMRRAALISSGAHRRAMATTRPGWFEYQVEAEARFSLGAGGRLPVDRRRRPRCSRRAQDGGKALVVKDYASDITRTFPVNGRFSGPQKDVYELVLAAQAACIAAIQPGGEFHDYHRAAERVLAQGFIDLGLCPGTLDEVLESGSYKQFYMHRTGHWLGMDVHDAGLYQTRGESIRLSPGMVLTVEPGAYIRPADNVPEAFWNIGVRIEDDLLVTVSGSENLTQATPRTVAAVEEACRRD